MAITSPGSATNFRVGNHRVTWNSVVLGLTVAGSEITYEVMKTDRFADQYGKTKLGGYVIGEAMEVNLVLREFTAANLGKAIPGSTTTSGLVEAGVQYAGSIDLASSAQELKLHPLDQDDAVLTYTWVIYKARPIISGPIPAKAEEDMVIPVKFEVYPDTSKVIGKQLFKWGA